MSTSTKQVFLITGCSSGLGFALAEHFLNAGHHVVATARDVSKISEFEKRFPRTALALKTDVTDRASIESTVSKTLEKFGQIDVLINNAGFTIVNVVENFKEEDIRRLMETNFYGAVFMTQAVLPTMRKQKSGTIIQISSTVGRISFPSTGAYSASKFALEGFSEALALEVGPHGIRVIIVEPGMFRSKIGDNATFPKPEDLDGYDMVKQILAHMGASASQAPGDPAKMAIAIEKILALEKPPLHIPLGKDSLQNIQRSIAQLSADFETYKDIITSTDFDDAPEKH